MSNSNINLQTQSSNALHNAIMEAKLKNVFTNIPIPPTDSKLKLIQIILTRIDNDIYSTVFDAMSTACEMWKAIERLETCESFNVQDLETNLYWSWKIHITEFLLQLQPEWKRFVTLVKQSQELKTVSYHKLYDILKQHQNEVNKIRAKRLARTANPLALVAQQQPVCHHQNPQPTQTLIFLQQLTTIYQKHKRKAIVTSPDPIMLQTCYGY
ncbi:hypothetical protein Tco_0702744 [Tanacetum coccineum]|uniref:Uncharacterized protein n=1 Tax=Tanacetum coccineum TaxID=301880 RepID=A0ABQ4XYS3_9ASTR